MGSKQKMEPKQKIKTKKMKTKKMKTKKMKTKKIKTTTMKKKKLDTKTVVIPTRLSMHVATAKTVTETVTSARAHAAAARLCLAFSPQQTNSNTPFAPRPPTRLSARVAAPDTTRARQGPHRCRRNRL
jgi:hypothetical protein